MHHKWLLTLLWDYFCVTAGLFYTRDSAAWGTPDIEKSIPRRSGTQVHGNQAKV